MALVRCEGIVLKTHALGDTSLIVVTYTREHGLLKLVAKAARRAPSRFGYALEPLSRSRFVVYHKPDRDLHLVSQAEVLEPTGSGLTDLTRLAHGQAALELIDRLVWGEEPHAELFDLLAAALQAVSRAPVGTLAAVTIGFELQVASLLGYRPRLDACANCGGSISPRRLFSPSRGGLLCDGCAAAEPGAVTLSADALAGLALLLSRPLREAGDWLQFTEVRRTGEIMRVVESFLRHHFQRFQGLRSLEMLRSLPGAEPGPEPGPNIRPNLGKDTPCPL